MTHIDATLAERGNRYGEFDDQAFIVQELKAVMQETPNWDLLKADQKEALEMVAHKIGRILNGDPNYIDNWHDILGYVRLVEQRLEKDQAAEQRLKQEQAAEQPKVPVTISMSPLAPSVKAGLVARARQIEELTGIRFEFV